MSIPMPHQSVMPAKVSPAPTKPDRFFGEAVHAGELGRVEPVERHELHGGDVDFRMFRRSADIEKVERFALLKAVVKLAWGDGFHIGLSSVMLVVAHVHDVVPAGCVVTFKTLLHARGLLPGEFLRDHREVPHEMAGGRLMALHALFGAG